MTFLHFFFISISVKKLRQEITRVFKKLRKNCPETRLWSGTKTETKQTRDKNTAGGRKSGQRRCSSFCDGEVWGALVLGRLSPSFFPSRLHSIQSPSSNSDSSSESEYSTAMRRERMVATSFPTRSCLASCSRCSSTFRN